MLGATSAIFLVPQNAFLQDKADPKRRGRILAASNLVNSSASLIAALAIQPWLQSIGVSSRVQFFCLGLLSLGVAIYGIKLLPSDFVRVHLKILDNCHFLVSINVQFNLTYIWRENQFLNIY